MGHAVLLPLHLPRKEGHIFDTCALLQDKRQHLLPYFLSILHLFLHAPPFQKEDKYGVNPI